MHEKNDFTIILKLQVISYKLIQQKIDTFQCISCFELSRLMEQSVEKCLTFNILHNKNSNDCRFYFELYIYVKPHLMTAVFELVRIFFAYYYPTAG